MQFSCIQYKASQMLTILTRQALQIMNFRESGDQDNDHEGNSEEVVIKIMITRKFLESGDQDNDHGVYS